MFSTIAFILVVMLLLLAALDLFVGVSNDAANFLNSAVGTRIAPLAIIMAVASVGVLTGATFSSGMMEIARKGMLHPDMFNFEEILLIFASVMVADVILLNLFNSLGLPTSTTVSIIFELLGAATFASFFKVYNTDLSYSEIFNYIKLDRTATIVSAILLSVVIAFIVGMMVQFIARVLFSFRFEKSVKVLGGVFCGISVTAIAFFLIMKGAKSASFMKPEYVEFLNSNFQLIMWSIFFIFTILGQIMVFTGGNVFRLIILAGTFALAFSFAGNDLVNFVGVPLAALDSWNEWQLNGLGDFHFMMDALNNTSVTSTFWLFLSGAIMCLTLWTSKKARHVIQTSINLSSSVSGAREQFGASTMGRIITRIGLGVSRTVYNVMPEKALQFIRVRYRAPVVVKGEDRLPFDYLRASINLVVAAALISFATSLKLPLSTTYVTFMVAMGTSFADGAWDRESAVYRISGVIT
ncbi:MAG: inorganic phosphate transporter, partial [Succinivibrio sp.]